MCESCNTQACPYFAITLMSLSQIFFFFLLWVSGKGGLFDIPLKLKKNFTTLLRIFNLFFKHSSQA